MPPRTQPFFEPGYPTPAPSPRSPNGSRRRSTTADFMNSPEYKRPSSSRRTTEADFSHDAPYNPTTSPRPGHHRGPFMHTPLHTPPPSSHANMPNIYSYVPGFNPAQQAEYVSYWAPPTPPHHIRSGSRLFYEYRPHPTEEDLLRTWTDQWKQFAHAYTPAPGPQSPPPHMRDGRRSRSHRREATWSGENSPRSPPKQSKSTPTPAPQPAKLDEEAIRRKAQDAGIPADYSLKNWDPSERPIILLGSVFDANSLGEWVFNWTKYHHGRTHEATRTAGGLWELLIELSSKLKRAREFVGQIRTPENREIVVDFMESGERLWSKLKDLLKACEEYMWTGARRVKSPRSQEGKAKVQMGRQSGAEFVDAMFNGEKEWEKTERLMRGMATWCQRFQVNCEEILCRPDA